VEAIDVLLLQKRPHNLLVNHTLNVRPTRPAVGTFTQRQERVDVTLVSSLRAQVDLSVVRLLALVPPPIGLVVVEQPWWRLVVDGHHPLWCLLLDELEVLFRASGHVLMSRVRFKTRFFLDESFARKEVEEELLSQHHAGTTMRPRRDVVPLPFHGNH